MPQLDDFILIYFDIFVLFPLVVPDFSWIILSNFVLFVVVVVGPFVDVSFQVCVVVDIALVYFCLVFSFVCFFSFQERKLKF